MKKNFLVCAWALALALLALVSAGAQETSQVITFNNVHTTIAPGSIGQTLTIQLWNAATAGSMLYCEDQILDVDANGAISFKFGAGTAPTAPCASGPPGLKPQDFPFGTSRFLDVVDGTGTSVLPNPPGRIALTAGAFALSAPHDVPGNVTMVNSTDTAGNILKDGVLFLSNFGTDNTFLGSNAGNLTTSGVGENTAIGTNALSRNTTGFRNTAIGAGALENNCPPSLCPPFSVQGTENTASGFNALFRNTTGFRNTASGARGLANNTTGINNTASGDSALQANTIGTNNTASGVFALFRNTTGSFNAATGEGALLNNTTGNFNTASGDGALLNNTTGIENTASGDGALLLNTTGGGNTAVGAFANVSAGNLTNATAIGFNAVVNANNKIRLGDSFVTLIEGEGDFHATGPGKGIILKSPNGAVCARLSIDDDGNLVTTAVVCP